MQRIVIKNFGPIKNVDIPIHDFMIFIGPQASGKSTIAKAIYFLKNLPTEILFIDIKEIPLIKDKTKNHFIEIIKQRSKEFFHRRFRLNLNGKFELKFLYDVDLFIEIRLVDYEIEVLFSEKLIVKLNSLEDTIREIISQDSGESLIKPIIRQEVRETLTSFIFNEFKIKSATQFVPSGRNIFSILSNQIQFIDNSNVDFTVEQYSGQLDVLRDFYGDGFLDLTDNKDFQSDIPKTVQFLAKNLIKCDH
jgi:AAA15 family ATPase/GTPase